MCHEMIPAPSRDEPVLNVIELFAGAAGLAQGFENASAFRTVALYDSSARAQETYLGWRPGAAYRKVDLAKVALESIKDDVGGRPLHGVLGGPPCQGFSINGKRQSEAETNQLVNTYGDAIELLEPGFVIMENVPQLLFHKYFAPLLTRLEKRYEITFGVLNAARYGAPQTRHRLLVVGYHRDLGVVPTLPPATHGQLGQWLYAYHLLSSNTRIRFDDSTAEAILGADPVISKVVQHQRAKLDAAITTSHKPFVTVGDAISDLPESSTGDDPVGYRTEAASRYQERLRSASGAVANVLVRRHVGRPLDIVTRLREGGTPSVEPGFIDKKYFSQAYARLHRDGLARTITTFFQNAGSGRFFHYERPRTLSVREAARLQGFPDDFVFRGNLAEQMQLVGNAVPLPLAEAVGRHVLAELSPALLD